jgi:hypothetical protein
MHFIFNCIKHFKACKENIFLTPTERKLVTRLEIEIYQLIDEYLSLTHYHTIIT